MTKTSSLGNRLMFALTDIPLSPPTQWVPIIVFRHWAVLIRIEWALVWHAQAFLPSIITLPYPVPIRLARRRQPSLGVPVGRSHPHPAIDESLP